MLSVITQGFLDTHLISQGYGEYSIIIPPDGGGTITEYSHVYSGLKTKFDQIGWVNLSSSGFLLENTKLPYIYLSKIANSLFWKDSQLCRYEKGIWQFIVYGEELDEVNTILDEIEELYDYSTIRLKAPLRFINLDWNNRYFKELRPQLIEGRFGFEIIVQKQLNSNGYQTRELGKNIAGVIAKRYKEYLGNIPFVTTEFQLENTPRPFVVCSEFKFGFNHRTTKSRIENLDLTFDIYAETLDEVLQINKDICQVFDACDMLIDNRDLLMVEWLSDGEQELIPDLWLGKVHYEIMLEKDLGAPIVKISTLTYDTLTETQYNSLTESQYNDLL